MGWWIGYAKAGHELEVAEAARAQGAEAHVARQVEAIRRGKQRWPEPVTTPILPNFVFLDMDDATWHRVRDVKWLAHTMRMVPAAEVRRLRDWLDGHEAAYGARMAQIEAGQRVSEYAPGDALVILGGTLGDALATFRRVVETAHEAHPQIETDMELMGRIVRVRVDPLNVRRARA